jgi:hypothetical protein
MRLGLRTTYEGPECPGFIAIGNHAVEFGLSQPPACCDDTDGCARTNHGPGGCLTQRASPRPVVLVAE